MRKVLVLLFFLMSMQTLVSGAADETEKPFEVTSQVQNEEIHIGDRIKLVLSVEDTAGYDILFPEELERLGDFSFIESRPGRSSWGQKKEQGRQYILTIYETGTHVIPPVEIMYKKSGETDWKTMNSPQAPLEVKSLLTGEDTDIRDLKGLVPIGGNLFLNFLVLAGVLIIAGLIWFVWWKKTRETLHEKALRRKSAYEIAYDELRQLKAMNLPAKGRIKEYYTRLSDIIRRYLENRFSFRAPEMTTEEFMEALKESPEMLRDHKDLLEDFLSHCDMVKFAKYGPTPLEMLDSFGSAERLLEQTRLVEAQEEKE